LSTTVNFKCICTLLFLGLAFAPSISGNRFCLIQIINKNGTSAPLYAEVAETEEARRRGLMHRKEMPFNRGMLFVFEFEQRLNFWMKDTYLPLSIAFIDKDGVITEICDMRPLDTSVIRSKMPARYALEVSRGWFAKNNITQGSRIPFHGCVGK